MAILQQIRERTLLTLVMIGLGMGGFIFMDSLSTNSGGCNNNPSSELFASFDGSEIASSYYKSSLRQVEQSYQNQSKEEHMRLAWDKVINDKIVRLHSNQIGIFVSDKELQEELQMGTTDLSYVSPYFRQTFVNPETNQFDTSMVRNFVENYSELDNNQKQLLKNLRAEATISRYTQKYQHLVEKGMYMTSDEVVNMLNDKSQRYSVRYVQIPYSLIEDEVLEITDEDINIYYQKNIDDYQVDEETRNLEYVTFFVSPSLQDDKNTMQKISSLVDKFSASKDDESFVARYSSPGYVPSAFPYLKIEDVGDSQFRKLLSQPLGSVLGPYKLENGVYRLSKRSDLTFRPDSVRARQILLSKENFSDDSAKLVVRDIRRKIKSGEDFGQLALQFSDDKRTSIKGGDLGWFQEQDMVKEFNDFCFNADKGDLKVVTTADGTHLVQILNHSKKIEQHKIVYIDKKIMPSEETQNYYHNKASDLLNYARLYQDDSSLSDIANSKNYSFREQFNLTPLTMNVSGIENSRDIVKWIFNHESVEGDISNKIYDFVDKFVVVRLSKINLAGDLPIDDVKDEITQKVKEIKKFEYISSQINSSDQELSNLESIASFFGVDVKSDSSINFFNPNIPSLGRQLEFSGKVRSTLENEISEPFMGNNFVFIIQNVSKTGNIIDEVKDQDRADAQRSHYSGRFFGSALDAIKEQSNIIDNRINEF